MQELLVQQLVKSYPGKERVLAVDHVDIEVQRGELLVLLGPSGCGKTTLLRCIAGLEDAQHGTITLERKTVFDATSRFNLPTYRRDIGMVFQNYSLWPHMTVKKNVEYPLRARGIDRAKRQKRIAEVLDVVQCSHLADRMPAMLSGGQQQRIALARALVSKPAIMLLDEPLSNLDALLRVDLRAQLRAIHRELGFTGIYVTHDHAEAFNLGTRVAVMRAGRIEQLASAADVYQKPITDYVAKFLGIRNSIELSFNGTWSTSAGPIEGDLGLQKRSAKIQMYVRPESVQLANNRPEMNGSRVMILPMGRVVDVLYSGSEVDYVVDVNDTTFYAKIIGSQVRFKVGDTVQPFFAAGDALFYAEGRLINV